MNPNVSFPEKLTLDCWGYVKKQTLDHEIDTEKNQVNGQKHDLKT